MHHGFKLHYVEQWKHYLCMFDSLPEFKGTEYQNTLLTKEPGVSDNPDVADLEQHL